MLQASLDQLPLAVEATSGGASPTLQHGYRDSKSAFLFIGLLILAFVALYVLILAINRCMPKTFRNRNVTEDEDDAFFVARAPLKG